MGAGDPCWRTGPDDRVSWAQHTAAGPATVALVPGDGAVDAEAWGPGAEAALVAIGSVLGGSDEPAGLDAVLGRPEPDPGAATDVDDEREPPGADAVEAVSALVERHRGFRLTATGRVVDAAVAAVCARGVSTFERDRAWALAVERLGDDAPGPGGLRLPPLPRRLAAADPYDLHVLGLESQRADEVRRVASHAARLDGAPIAEAAGRLGGIVGLGADVVEHVRSVAFGEADALPVVDPHLAHLVVDLVGPPGADRDDLAIALEPFRPHRGRVVRLVGLSAASA